MNRNTALQETPPEGEATGAEASFLAAFQANHPEYTLTEIRSALRHVALELALQRDGEFLRGQVRMALLPEKG